MNQRAIIHIIAAVIGIPVLLSIGIWSATDPMYAGIATLLVVGAAALTQLGTRCWVLIPMCAAFTGALNVVPGHFAPRDLAVGLVALLLPPLWVMRRFPIRVRVGSIEIGLMVLLVFIVQAYLRNPVGLSIFGSETIGGRPYFEIAVSVVAFVILSILVVDFKNVRLLVYANFGGSMFSAMVETVLGVFPALAMYSASIYQTKLTSLAITRALDIGADPSQGAGRISYLSGFSTPLMTLVLAFRTPMEFLNPRNLKFLILALISVVCILLSGFRSGVSGLVMLGIAAFFLHRKPLQLMFAVMIGVPMLAVFLALQGTLIELPRPAQRALSFLPADWDSRAVKSAEGSSEWRFLMWREALFSDRWIRNKWIGDGYGFTAAELDYQFQLTTQGVQTVDEQDYHLAIGSYHSGPIETIKRIGYIGLTVLLIVMGVFFSAAVSLVNQARGTPYLPYSLFVALPLVILPFYFILIFGAFQQATSTLLLGGGMLRMVGNSLDVWRASKNPQLRAGTGGRKADRLSLMS